jgi:hypothetical protein
MRLLGRGSSRPPRTFSFKLPIINGQYNIQRIKPATEKAVTNTTNTHTLNMPYVCPILTDQHPSVLDYQ